MLDGCRRARCTIAPTAFLLRLDLAADPVGAQVPAANSMNKACPARALRRMPVEVKEACSHREAEGSQSRPDSHTEDSGVVRSQSFPRLRLRVRSAECSSVGSWANHRHHERYQTGCILLRAGCVPLIKAPGFQCRARPEPSRRRHRTAGGPHLPGAWSHSPQCRLRPSGGAARILRTPSGQRVGPRWTATTLNCAMPL